MKIDETNRMDIRPFIIAIFAIIGLFMIIFGHKEIFDLWGVPVLSPEFADLRTITAGAETLSEGEDPYIVNQNDPWQRPMNYPRVWLMLAAYIGINQSHTIYFGAIISVLFIIGLLIFFKRRIEANRLIIFLLAIFSPTVMLSIERGNNDIFIFFILSVSIYILSRRKQYSALISFALTSLAFIFKLFPLFTIIIFAKEKSSIFIKCVISMVVIVVFYAFISYSDLLLIFKNTPKDPYMSYGMNVLWQAAIPISDLISNIIRVISAFLVFSSFFVFRYGLKTKINKNDGQITLTEAGFLTGVSIYLGTFLIGSNFDYRLIFLLFTLPMLIELANHHTSKISLISKISLVLILISQWHVFISDKMFLLLGRSFPALIVDEIANWLLFFSFSYLLGVLFPENARILRAIKKIKTAKD
jgi:hypothetical protein